MGVDVLLVVFIAVNALLFTVFYSFKNHRCNSEFSGQLHCLSGIILCNKPLFGFCMHCVGCMMLLSAALRVDRDKEISLLILALMFISLSGVVSFDVRDHKPIHFLFLSCVLASSLIFVWLQCNETTKETYAVISALFVALILFNFTYTHWKWHWMDVQAIVEIAWVLTLLGCMLSFCFSESHVSTFIAQLNASDHF